MAEELEGSIVDTTVIYYTANTLREPFAENVREELLKSIGMLPLISVSHKPMVFGENIVFNGERKTENIYKQILIGAKAAKTRWVAMAEDDTLYSKDHFNFKLKEDGFWFDVSRWSVFTWANPPMYSLKRRISMSTGVCNREMLIDLLERRFAIPEEKRKGHLWSEPGKYDRNFGIKGVTYKEFSSPVPCITFTHPDALGYEIQGNRKRQGEIKAYDIPYWGKASDIINNYYLDIDI